MAYAKAHILVAEGAFADDATRIITAAGDPIANIQPVNPVEFGAEGNEVTFQISVAAVVGSPSAWSLGAKFQYCLPHSTGYQYSAPVWFDLDADNVETNVVEGVGFYGPGQQPPVGGGFGIIADQTSSLRVTVQRTIKHFGRSVRVMLDPQFTGGTNPGLKATVIAIVKD